MTNRSPLLFAIAVLVVVLSSCGASAPTPATVDSTEPAPAPAAENAGAAAVGDPVEENLQSVVRSADSSDEQQTSTGATVIVAIDCDSPIGGDLISVAAAGLPVAEIHEGRGEPAFGGAVTLQTLPDGRGVGGRSATLDADEYVVNFPTLDGGMSFTLQGCP